MRTSSSTLLVSAPHSDRKLLRKVLRERRRALTPSEQKAAARRLALQLSQVPALQRATDIAVYLPNDGEIDPTPFMKMASAWGKRFYLPVLHPFYPGRLAFRRYRIGEPLRPNRFGIPEPQFRTQRDGRAPWGLDAVLLPLVGFDREGGRLGMGGGFYDRTFACRKRSRHYGPTLLGLAHDCQQVEKLPLESWDIPLDGVVTDRDRLL